MNRDNDRQTSIILAVLGILPIVWLGLLIAPSVKGGLPEILPSLMNVMSDPFSYRALRGQRKNCPRFASLLWNEHRDLLLYTQELSTPGGTRQRKMGQCQSRGQEIPAEPTVRKQADDAGSLIGLNSKKHRRNLNALVCGGFGAGIFGPFFICDCSTPYFGSLNKEQLERYTKQFQNPERFFRVGGEIKAVPYKPEKDHER